MFLNNPNNFIVNGNKKSYTHDPNNVPKATLKELLIISQVLNKKGKNGYYNKHQYENKIHDDKKEIFWSSGACFMIKSKVFKEVNGFDFDFFAHMEEIDLCWRLKNVKYKNFCQPKSLVYHAGGETLSDNNPRKTYLNFRNNLMMILKNENLFYAFPKIFMRLILDTFASVLISVKKKSIFH